MITTHQTHMIPLLVQFALYWRFRNVSLIRKPSPCVLRDTINIRIMSRLIESGILKDTYSQLSPLAQICSICWCSVSAMRCSSVRLFLYCYDAPDQPERSFKGISPSLTLWLNVVGRTNKSRLKASCSRGPSRT